MTHSQELKLPRHVEAVRNDDTFDTSVLGRVENIAFSQILVVRGLASDGSIIWYATLVVPNTDFEKMDGMVVGEEVLIRAGRIKYERKEQTFVAQHPVEVLEPSIYGGASMVRENVSAELAILEDGSVFMMKGKEPLFPKFASELGLRAG